MIREVFETQVKLSKTLRETKQETNKLMPIKIIGGFPCRNCGCWFVEERTDCEYYWVDFGVVLIEEITNYSCRNSKCILIQITRHKEEKLD